MVIIGGLGSLAGPVAGRGDLGDAAQLPVGRHRLLDAALGLFFVHGAVRRPRACRVVVKEE